MTEIRVVCDDADHARGRPERPENVAWFSRDQHGQWSVSGSNPAARRPSSKPGKPLRVIVPLGPDGYPGGKLRCKQCGQPVPPVSLAVLNDLVAQGVSRETIEELRVLGST
jgi:hypothetical protein